jgi:hypothetical protein
VRSSLAVLALLLALPAFGATEKKVDGKAAEKPRPPTVTLDVKDEEVRDILKSMQRQCGIKNLAIDPEVHGKATFYLRNIPCAKAFDVVLRTFGLRSVTYSSSLTAVEKRP